MCRTTCNIFIHPCQPGGFHLSGGWRGLPPPPYSTDQPLHFNSFSCVNKSCDCAYFSVTNWKRNYLRHFSGDKLNTELSTLVYKRFVNNTRLCSTCVYFISTFVLVCSCDLHTHTNDHAHAYFSVLKAHFTYGCLCVCICVGMRLSVDVCVCLAMDG